MLSDLNTLTGYDQFGSEWDNNFGQEGYWDAKSDMGRTNWTNWARRATEADWTSLGEKLGQDPTELQANITGALGTDDPPQVYKPELFPTAYKGVDKNYISQIMSSVVPQLSNSVNNYEGNVDQYTKEAASMGRNNAKTMLDSVLQSSMNTLNSRNMLNSTVAGNVMGNATGEVMKNISNQTYQAGMESAKLKAAAPSMLAQVAGLGEYSESEDPSVPQQILANTITGIS